MPFVLFPNPTESQLRQYRRHHNQVRVLSTESIFGRRVTFRYFQRVKNDDYIAELCMFAVGGHRLDPELAVFCEEAPGCAPDRRHYWDKRLEHSADFGELAVFRPPAAYKGGPVALWFDYRRHWGEAYQADPRTVFSFPS